MTQEQLKETLAKHQLWLQGIAGGVRANFASANLEHANIEGANLEHANFTGANLEYVNLEGANLKHANLEGANLEGANFMGANLEGADLWRANLRSANLTDANLTDANLLCLGNMKEIRTMQIDTWDIGYTADTLQIGCKRHPIDKWRKWNTPAGRMWIKSMDEIALEWADRNLALVLALIDANPATRTGHEGKTND